MDKTTKSIEFQLTSNKTINTYDSSEVVDLISKNGTYWKVSYGVDLIDFRWLKIVKGRVHEETKLYCEFSKEFRESEKGTIFWANSPLSLLCDIVCEDTKKDIYVSYSDRDIMFYRECAIRWPLLTHEIFCNHLRTLI